MARRNPLPALIGVLSLPALLLAGLTLTARGNAAEPPPATLAPTPVTPPALAAPLLSVRRGPVALAADVREDAVTAAAQTLGASTDGASCLAIGADGMPLVGANSELAVIPASTLKIVTVAVALDVLGPDHVFTTEVRGNAPASGVVEGDLVLVGGGDPVLGEAWYAEPTSGRKRPPNVITSVEALADAVVAAGVTSITGRVVGDGSRYDDELFPPGWAPDLRQTFDFPPIGALSINDTTSRSEVVGAKPALHAAQVLTGLLRERGVSVAGEAAAGPTASTAEVIAQVQSAPLATVAREVLSTSDNGAAEMLLKEVGRAALGTGTRTAGVQAIIERLVQWGVPTAGVVITDGSGLSRDNQLTCNTLLAVLRRSPIDGVLGEGLAVAGEDGTTLADQLEREGIEGVLRAKTGSLSGVKALAGYFPAGGQTFSFVLILNGDSAAGYAAAWELLGTSLLAGTSTPSADALAPSLG